MIHCNSEYRACALNLPDECASTKLRVSVNHVGFHLVTQFYYQYYHYYYNPYYYYHYYYYHYHNYYLL